MTNSEIKKCDHNSRLCKSGAEWCTKCGAFSFDYGKNWQFPALSKHTEDKHINCTGEWHCISAEDYEKRHGAYPRSCPQCHGCFNSDTRTPEPTKAENGLDKNKLYDTLRFLVTYPPEDNELAREAAIQGTMKRIYRECATTSITKEQLLAILPEKKITHTASHIITDADEAYGYNQAIDQMKQRIEELWK